MRILHLIHEANHLISLAHGSERNGFQEAALRHLVELRELLNNEPQLEAGGALEVNSEDQTTET